MAGITIRDLLRITSAHDAGLKLDGVMGDTRTTAEWAQACAGEAVLLVQASQPAAPVDLTALVGLT